MLLSSLGVDLKKSYLCVETLLCKFFNFQLVRVVEDYSDFFQEPPVLENQFIDDIVLQSYLKRKLPNHLYLEIERDLKRLGERVITDIYEMGKDAEKNEPVLKQFDVWGKRVDVVEVAKGWQSLGKVSAEEGLVAIGYERKYGDLSRIYQFAKLYLFTPSSAVYTCPLAMTDGAARLIEVYGDEFLKKQVYPQLISRDPQFYWTSGQWMTERTGGSDVARALTIAEPVSREKNEYSLHGHKWFTSSITSEIAMTLAKIRQPDGSIPPGSRYLSLFYVKVKNDDGTYNNIEIEALKNKLGTKALPTAQIALNGTMARLIGEEGNGVKKIATLFNITRIYNALTSVSYMRRAIALSYDYSFKREAFKKRIIDHPLHIQALAKMQVEFEGNFHLVFYEIELLGKDECGTATEDEKKLLRLLTPVCKLYTAKRAIELVSEHLEMIGGLGYLEDTGLPVLLRDSQVLSIWEGTTNVLSLDMLRAMKKELAFESFTTIVRDKINALEADEFRQEKASIQQAFGKLQDFMGHALTQDKEYLELVSRDVAYSIAQIMAGVLLIEHAIWCSQNNIYPNSKQIAKMWFDRDLTPFERLYGKTVNDFKEIIKKETEKVENVQSISS